MCDIPYRTLQNYLLSDREPNAKALIALCTHLGVSIDWLLTGSGQMFTTRQKTQAQAALTPREQAMLTLFSELGEDEQREICRLAEDKKRLRDLESEILELKNSVETLKTAL